MKFLEAKMLTKEKDENKMKPGSRPDQRGSTADRVESAPVKKEVQDLAHQLDVDLRTVKGTGPNGAITLRDVKTAKDAADKAFLDK
jgi:pyruvate/2-oxoglutarate dehydrogenase complex dihydrolipoamide acyltransferase (E2) component